MRISKLNPGITSICMYYNNSAASNGENVIGTWNSNYELVLHLGESSGTIYDSTSNSNDFTARNTPTYGATGEVGDGMGFEEMAGIIEYLESQSDINASGWSGITMEVWVNADAWVGVPKPLSWDNNNLNDDRIGIEYGTGVNPDRVTIFAVDASANQKTQRAARDNVGTGEWHYLVGTWDGTTSNYPKSYIDGSDESYVDAGFDKKQIALSDLDDLHKVLVGWSGYHSPTHRYDGKIDEVRISKTVRSADWLKMTYKVIKDQSSYINVGDEEDY
jgi:hypothetical protein